MPFICFPYIRNGEVVFVKWRDIADKDNMFRSPKGADSVLFGLHLLDKSVPFVVLVEGEFDAMAGLACGVPNVFSVPNGADGFDPSWLPDLEFAQVVVIGYDNDDAGHKGAKKAAGKLGMARCKRVVWPKKDLNDCLMAGLPAQEIMDILGAAKDTPPEDLKSAETVYDEMLADDGQGKGAPTKWTDLNGFLGGIRQGEITVLVGDTASGKTTFALNMVLDAMTRGDHALIVSSEMGPKQVMSKLASMIASKDYLGHAEEDRGKVRVFLREHPLFFLDVHGPVPQVKMQEVVTYCATAYGVKFVLLDHLHFFVEAEPDQERQALDSYMRAIVSVKQQTNAHILLIAHIRATQRDGEKVGMAAIKGTSGIKQDADNVISIWRDTAGEIEGRPKPVALALLKNRALGTVGIFRLGYDTASQTYANHDSALPVARAYDD